MGTNLKLLRTCGSTIVGNRAPFLKLLSLNINRHIKLSSTVPTTTNPPESNSRYDNISKAMRTYLERAKANDAFMKMKKEEFELGKRHLANIMGVDADDLTQEEINKAIEYLMPSGLFQPRARPIMKSPEKVYPKRKDAEFDASGRPHHTFFFCRKPNFYQILYDAADKMQEANAYEDQMVMKGQPNPTKKLDLAASDWMSQDKLSQMILETISDQEYLKFKETMEKLASHPFSYLAEELIMKYRTLKIAAMTAITIAPLSYDADGRPYVVVEGTRKLCTCTLTLKGQGSGKFSLNGMDILQFFEVSERKQVMFPLQFTGLLGKMDIEATANACSERSLAGATRLALAKALCSFVDEGTMEDMRLAGLLTVDPRTHERQKPGQKGARAKYKWLKR